MKKERYGLDEEKENIATSQIIFANIMSYFCFVFHHTAGAFSIKLFLKCYKRDKFLAYLLDNVNASISTNAQ